MISFRLSFILALVIVVVKTNRQKQRLYSEVSSPSFHPWQTIGSFADSRKFHGSTLINNKIYIFGGYFSNASAVIYFSDVQFLSLNTNDGTIVPGSLSLTQSFSTGRAGFGVAYYNSYVYLVGGFSGSALLDDVQIGHVEEDGQILSWQTSPFRLNTARSNYRLEVVITASGNPYLAAIGGTIVTSGDLLSSDGIEVAKIYYNGSIGQWYTCPYHIKGGRGYFATNVVNNTLYVIGGAGSFTLGEVFTDIQFASIQNNGCPSSWSTSAHNLKMPLYGHTSLTINSNTFIVLGGNVGERNYVNNVQFATLHTDYTDTKPWILDSNQLSLPRYGHTSVQLNDKFIYVIGGKSEQDGGDLDSIQMSTVTVTSTNNDDAVEKRMKIKELIKPIIYE